VVAAVTTAARGGCDRAWATSTARARAPEPDKRLGDLALRHAHALCGDLLLALACAPFPVLLRPRRVFLGLAPCLDQLGRVAVINLVYAHDVSRVE
jgi:hypothetical protein